MTEVALGVPVFKRTERLESLLESVPEYINTVYIADDGNISDRRHVYNKNFDFYLKVLELEYDSGLGKKRAEIVNALEEPYLLVVDSDHIIPQNASILRDQLESNQDLGGISGVLNEYGSLRAGAHNLYEESGYLKRDIRGTPDQIDTSIYPLYKFDFIPNVAVFRSECLQDYYWDPEYVIGKDHVDFYVGHLRNSGWKFAVNPCVVFDHYPGGSENYLQNRQQTEKHHKSEQYFLDKWGYNGIIRIQHRWIDSYSAEQEFAGLLHSGLRMTLRQLPNSMSMRLINIINRFSKYDL